MKRQSKQSKYSIRRFLCVSILIVGIITFSSMRINATTVSFELPSYASLTPHDPISITSDGGFAVFPGSGTVEDPYVIEGYNITTTASNGIYITGTTKHFTVRNCYVDANDYGFYIDNVADGTAIVINNTCNNNNWRGIYIRDSDSSTVANNTCENNGNEGIFLYSSVSLTIENNTCSSNDYGIYLSSSGSSTVIYNTCNNNEWEGIYLYSSVSSTIANNTSNNNYGGIKLSYSGVSTVANNTCTNNNWDGIYLYESDFCDVIYNILQENDYFGVSSPPSSDNNLIHHNNFVDNNLGGTSQAIDDGSNNLWYDTATSEGNYWDDWSGTGSYSIFGEANSVDLYPLDEPTVFLGPPVITNIIHSPSSPTELDTISINAIVTSPYGVQSVTLNYRVNSGTWIEVSMTIVSGDLYSVTIGPFAVSETIEYYITAVDNSINYNEATEDNSGLYYSFTVSEVIPEFQTLSLLSLSIILLFLGFGLVVLQRRKK